MRFAVSILAVILAIAFGCAPTPVSRETHRKQVEESIVKAGGATNIAAESRTLFGRLSVETKYTMFWRGDGNSNRLDGLSGLATLGDVFRYDPVLPDRIEVRVYNSHRDGFFITLLNPDMGEPPGFERIGGNVGFLEPSGAGK